MAGWGRRIFPNESPASPPPKECQTGYACGYREKINPYTALDCPPFEKAIPALRRSLAEQGRVNRFSYYQATIEGLLAIDRVKPVPLAELAAGGNPELRLVGLRHDVDADSITALRAARLLARFGIGGSFYLLHTSPYYYGTFVNGLFIRNPNLAELVRGFIVSGCEIGVHNDALSVFLEQGLDGLESFCSELAWLRSQGARIVGTVAHNSGPIYGAENYEIFKGRRLWERQVTTPKGLEIPLGVLSEEELGLKYEGTFAKPKENIHLEEAARFLSDAKASDVTSESWMRSFLHDNPYCDYDLDMQFWLIGLDRWMAAGRIGRERVFEWNVGLGRVLKIIAAMPLGSRSVVVIHPVYISG